MLLKSKQWRSICRLIRKGFREEILASQVRLEEEDERQRKRIQRTRHRITLEFCFFLSLEDEAEGWMAHYGRARDQDKGCGF